MLALTIGDARVIKNQQSFRALLLEIKRCKKEQSFDFKSPLIRCINFSAWLVRTKDLRRDLDLEPTSADDPYNATSPADETGFP